MPFQVNNLQSSKVYSQVIDILKELSASGNVGHSLHKIDALINGLQGEIEEERQPTISLNLSGQKDNYQSPSPPGHLDLTPLTPVRFPKKVFEQFSGSSLRDLVVSRQLTKNDAALRQASSTTIQCLEDTRTQPNSDQLNWDTHGGRSLFTGSHFGNNFSASNGSIMKPGEHQIIKTAPKNNKVINIAKDSDFQNVSKLQSIK